MRGKHGLAVGGGEESWAGRVGVWAHTTRPVHRPLWGGRLGEIYSLYLPLPLYIYNSRFQGYAPELFFNQKNENVNKEEE